MLQGFVVVCFFFFFTYVERGQLICDIQDVFDSIGHSTDDPVDDMNHTICGYLVTMDDPGTVHCYNLHTEERFTLKYNRVVHEYSPVSSDWMGTDPI